jgi:hypothetical protein
VLEFLAIAIRQEKEIKRGSYREGRKSHYPYLHMVDSTLKILPKSYI